MKNINLVLSVRRVTVLLNKYDVTRESIKKMIE